MFPVPLFCSSPLPTSESRTFLAVYSESEEGKCVQLPKFLLCSKIALELKVLLSFLNDVVPSYVSPSPQACGMRRRRRGNIHLHAVVSVLPVCAVPWRPLTSSATWFVLDDYWWLSLRKKGGLESNNCICLRKFSRSKMGGLDTICSWQTMSPWANFFIFLCLAFPGITGNSKMN